MRAIADRECIRLSAVTDGTLGVANGERSEEGGARPQTTKDESSDPFHFHIVLSLSLSNLSLPSVHSHDFINTNIS